MENPRNIFYMTGIVIAAIAILLFFNLASFFWNPNPENYIAHNQVRGIDVQRHHTLYTLNFSQQNETINFLNRSIVVGKDKYQNPDSMPDIDKIIIYRFNQPDINVIPLGMVGNEYIFSVPEFSTEGLLKDVSHGAFKQLISTTYDNN